MVAPRRGEAAARERRVLHEGDVHRRHRLLPVVRRVRAHVVVAAAPLEIQAGRDLRQAVDARPVLDLVQRRVRRAPRAAERIPEAVCENVVRRGDAVGGVVERVVLRRRAVEVHPQDFSAEEVQVRRDLGVEAVADVDVELPVGADADARDLMRRADLFARHVEQRGDTRRGAAAVDAVDADDARVVLARGRGVDDGDEEVAAVGIDRGADDAMLAGAGEDAGRIEVEQVRRVVAHRPVAEHGADRSVQLRHVEDRRVGVGERARNEGDVDRQLQAADDALHRVAAVDDLPRRVGAARERDELRRRAAGRGRERAAVLRDPECGRCGDGRQIHRVRRAGLVVERDRHRRKRRSGSHDGLDERVRVQRRRIRDRGSGKGEEDVASFRRQRDRTVGGERCPLQPRRRRGEDVDDLHRMDGRAGAGVEIALAPVAPLRVGVAAVVAEADADDVVRRSEEVALGVDEGAVAEVDVHRQQALGARGVPDEGSRLGADLPVAAAQRVAGIVVVERRRGHVDVARIDG